MTNLEDKMDVVLGREHGGDNVTIMMCHFKTIATHLRMKQQQTGEGDDLIPCESMKE